MATKKAKKSVQLNWRPNFRVEEKLPDIKVIRTGFLLNVIVIVVAAGLASMVVFNEYATMSKQESFERIQKTIEDRTPINRNRIQLNTEFNNVAVDFEELESFLNTSITPAQLLLLIGEKQPPESLISQVEMRGVASKEGQEDIYYHRIVITGTMVASETTREPQLINNFYNALIDSEELQPLLRDRELTFQRDDELGVFNYNIRLNVNLDPKEETADSPATS